MNQTNSCWASPGPGQINPARTELTWCASVRASLQYARQHHLEVLEQMPCRDSLILSWLTSSPSLSPEDTPGQELLLWHGSSPVQCWVGVLGVGVCASWAPFMQRAEGWAWTLCHLVWHWHFSLSGLKPSEVNLHNAKFSDLKLKGQKCIESHSTKPLMKLSTRPLLRMGCDCVLRLTFHQRGFKYSLKGGTFLSWP